MFLLRPRAAAQLSVFVSGYEPVDAGERLRPRLDGLSAAVAAGDASFAAAAEFACSAIKHAAGGHDIDLPAPFGALDTAAYRHHGVSYAVQWAETTFEKLDD